MQKQTSRRYQSFFITAISLAVLGGVPTLAVAEEDSSDRQATTLEAITVTANKQEENIQDVPMSITAFDEFVLDDKDINSIDKLTDYVPNLILSNSSGIAGYARPAMRGILAEIGAGISTAMFIDGIPFLSHSGYNASLQDIERVEVLRGPQGTLYGKSAEAGAINIITRQPDNDFRGKIALDGGENYKKEVSVNISGPILQDKLFFGLSGQYYDKDGWIKNGYTDDNANDKAHWYGKGQLRWTPITDLAISFIFSQLQYDNVGADMGLSKDGAAALGLTPSGDREVYSGFDGWEKSKNSDQSLKISYDFGDTLNVTSITAHHSFDTDYGIDFDYNPVELNHGVAWGEEDKISQELRLSSNTEKMRWVIGFYYDKDDNTTNAKVNIFRLERANSGDAYALFGQLRYALTSRMGITGGLRYETQNKDFQDYLTGKSFDNTWHDTAPKVSVDYAVTEWLMGYVTVAKGFRPGGFNAMSNDPKYDSYESEKLWSYEIGAKSQLLNNRLIVNGALFYMDIDDMQVTEEMPGQPWGHVTNVGSAVSYGVELEAQAKITPQFTMTGSLGYTNVTFDEYKDILGDYGDNKVPNIPEYTFAIGGQYRATNGLYVGVDLLGSGEMFLERTNKYKRDAYQLMNAKIGYEAETWDVYLYGKNIFDKDYSSEGAGGIFYSLPREIGIKLTYRF